MNKVLRQVTDFRVITLAVASALTVRPLMRTHERVSRAALTKCKTQRYHERAAQPRRRWCSRRYAN